MYRFSFIFLFCRRMEVCCFIIIHRYDCRTIHELEKRFVCVAGDRLNWLRHNNSDVEYNHTVRSTSNSTYCLRESKKQNFINKYFIMHAACMMNMSKFTWSIACRPARRIFTLIFFLFHFIGKCIIWVWHTRTRLPIEIMAKVTRHTSRRNIHINRMYCIIQYVLIWKYR